MDQILELIGGAIGSIFDNPVVQLGIQGFFVYWVVLWIAAAYWAFRDMQTRTDNPIAPYLAAAAIVAFTPILFPLAVFTYRVIRPQERVGEVYERNLAEEALLNEIEAVRHCPSCDRRVDPEWIICPTCRTRLNRVCPNCSRLIGLEWTLCAWCGRDFERRDAAAIVTAPSHDALPIWAEGSAGRLPASASGPTDAARTPRRAAPRAVPGGTGSAGNRDPLAER